MTTRTINPSQQILSDITVYQKYAKYIPLLSRKENWEEICERNKEMHIKKYPNLKTEIEAVYRNFVLPKKVLPSMRSLQFAGQPVEINQSRQFNCSYLPMDHPVAFAEVMFLLLGGTGVGYSVQKQHIEKLPGIVGPKKRPRRFLIGDSIEGWADSIKVLIKAYTQGKSDPAFDFRDIRPKGARLITSGGKAPGPDPLRICLDQIRSVLNDAIGRKLTSLEVHDINCFIADAVLAGGIRRAAMIALFSKDDMDMLSAKSGAWYELNPQRGRANNSVALLRSETTKEEFLDIYKRIELSQAGEPGFFWTDDLDWGTNPCAEISLRPCQFCNLTEINAANIFSQEDYNARAKAAAFLGTLQAGYTDFHYLRNVWQDTTESEALLGVSATGIASREFQSLDDSEAARVVLEENERVANLIGINKAARTTCIKPAGTTSLVLGTSSGVHAWHDPYYIRRVRVGKNEALYSYLIERFPDLIEDCKFKPHIEAVMSFPQKAPEEAITRGENALEFLERVKKVNQKWVHTGHREGANRHNVSCTINIRDEEWVPVGEWLWNNRETYTGVSIIPYDGGTYVQAPFESCTEEDYNRLNEYFESIDLTEVIEEDDNTNHSRDSVACAGGMCAI